MSVLKLKKSELLEVVVEDFKFMLQDPEYVFDPFVFHSRQADGKVHCCFAGCLVRLLYRNPDYAHDRKFAHTYDYYSTLIWLDLVRVGLIRQAYNSMSDYLFRTTLKTKVLEIPDIITHQSPENMVAVALEVRNMLLKLKW